MLALCFLAEPQSQQQLLMRLFSAQLSSALSSLGPTERLLLWWGRDGVEAGLWLTRSRAVVALLHGLRRSRWVEYHAFDHSSIWGAVDKGDTAVLCDNVL